MNLLASGSGCQLPILPLFEKAVREEVPDQQWPDWILMKLTEQIHHQQGGDAASNGVGAHPPRSRVGRRSASNNDSNISTTTTAQGED